MSRPPLAQDKTNVKKQKKSSLAARRAMQHKIIAKHLIERLSPSQVDYWPALKRVKKYFPADKILVITGPGSFSFTRTAVNVANTLGFGWDVPVISLDRKPGSRFEKMELSKILQIVLSSAKTITQKKFVPTKRALPFYSAPAYRTKSARSKKNNAL